jgi:lysophospholipase L1-like esterase
MPYIPKTFNSIAPLLIQQYNRYSPTSFDSSLTMLEKVNKIIKYLDSVGKLANDLITEWDEAYKWLSEEGLETAVDDVLNQWLTDGKLEQLIDASMFNELNAKNGKSTNLFNKAMFKLRNNLPTSITFKGDSIIYGTDFNSSDKRAADPVAADDGTAHTSTRASVTMPEAFSLFINEIYEGNVTIKNQGYSGDGAEKGFQHWNASGTDFCVMNYGINDAGNDSISYMGDVEQFVYWYRQLIERELNNGTAVILLSPTKQRIVTFYDTDYRTDVDVFASAVKMLANEYNLPYIDGHELLKNYSADLYSDYTHFTGSGYRVFAARLVSLFVGSGIYSPVRVHGGDSLLARTQLDNVNGVNSAIGINAGSPTPSEFDAGSGVSIIIKNDGAVYWSFYAEEDGLVVIPSLYTPDTGAVAKLELDFGLVQPQWNNYWSYNEKDGVNADYRETSIVTIPKALFTSYGGNVYSRHMVKTKDQPVLKITTKGWHTIKITGVMVDPTINLSINELYFMSLTDYRNTIYKKIPLTLANGATPIDTPRTPYLLVKGDGTAHLTGTLTNVPISTTTEFAMIDVQYAPVSNTPFVVALSTSAGGGYAIIYISASGFIRCVYSSTGDTFLNLHGCIWTVGQ